MQKLTSNANACHAANISMVCFHPTKRVGTSGKLLSDRCEMVTAEMVSLRLRDDRAVE